MIFIIFIIVLHPEKMLAKFLKICYNNIIFYF